MFSEAAASADAEAKVVPERRGGDGGDVPPQWPWRAVSDGSCDAALSLAADTRQLATSVVNQRFVYEFNEAFDGALRA